MRGKTLQQYIDEKTKNPEFKKYWNDLDKEFEITEEIIKTREKAEITKNKKELTFNDLKKELLADPEVNLAYKELGPEYDIIRQVIKARVEQNLTQAQLAKKIGTRQSNISRLEHGNYNPSLSFLKKLALGLGKELQINIF